MMAFPGMLVSAAEKAGMKIPADPDDFDANEYPHFQVFCIAQLCRRMQLGEHWENAKIIAAIPEDKIRITTLEEMIDMGFQIST